MKVFKCVVSGDEMFSDSFRIEERDGVYVIKGKFVTRSGDEVDSSLLGANPSAEEQEEGVDAASESGVDVVLDMRLKETGFGSKKDYQVYMKDYMKRIVSKVQESGTRTAEEVSSLKTETTKSFMELIGKYKELQFFTGVSMDPDGMCAIMEWKDEEVDGQTSSVPYLYFFKLGLLEEKY